MDFVYCKQKFNFISSQNLCRPPLRNDLGAPLNIHIYIYVTSGGGGGQDEEAEEDVRQATDHQTGTTS